MLTNSKGNVLFVEAINFQNMTVAVYESLKTYNAYVKAPTSANQPDRLSINIGDNYQVLLGAITASDIPTGKTLSDLLPGLQEQALINQIKSNVRSFPRTKFDVVDFV